MAHTNFGVILPIYGEKRIDWKSILNYVKTVERLGFNSIWVPDHLTNPFLEDSFMLDSWTVLSALALITKTIRLGTYVLCNQYRNPSLIAKMVSTLDVISNGRVDLGIGACWFKKEFDSFGLNWASRRTRLERLKESIKVIRALMNEEKFSFHGKYYNLKEATLNPKPIQKPNPPIWIGGNSKEIMEITAELGDGWIPEGLPPENFASGVAFIKNKAKEFGRDPNKILFAWGGSGIRNIIAKDEDFAIKIAESTLGLLKPHLLPWIIGSPTQCIKKIESYIKAGATHIVLGFYDFPSTQALKLFSKTILSTFK